MEHKRATRKLGLISKMIIAIILGIVVGQLKFIPELLLRVPVTFSSIFSALLGFIIPLMIIGFVIMGIADLSQGAGKLLALTTLIAYGSTLAAGMGAYMGASFILPRFIDSGLSANLTDAGGLAPLFTFKVPPMLDVTTAIVFAFIFGITLSWLKRQDKGEYLYGAFNDFSLSIHQILRAFIIPCLPWFIFGNFLNMSYSGTVFDVLSVFWKVFVMIICFHCLYLLALFFLAGFYGGKNPFRMLRNQVPGYLTAIGTQSSAATIPVNVGCAERNGVSREIREFVVPLCATIHLCGSIITITSCVLAVLLMYDMPHSFEMMMGFIVTLGIAMVAAPGAPGGAIMSALPFLGMVGIEPTGALATLLISLYLTQDSFGTAANVSGDNAIAVIVDRFYQKHVNRSNAEE